MRSVHGSSWPSRALARLSLTDALGELGDELVVAGQTVRDAADYKVESRGQGLWVGQLAAGRSSAIETELQLTGRRVKDYHCECSAFAKTQACRHLAALVAAVELRKQVRASKRSKSPQRRPQTASVKRLLQSVSEADLRDFVVEHARKHTDFALDLRVRFAESLPLANRFEQVIKNLLKRTGKRFSPSQARRISDALERFGEQRERYLAERAFLDLFELNTTLVPRLIVIADKAERLRVDLAEYVEACIRELATVAESSPPPVILERLEKWLGEQLERGAYFRQGGAAGLLALADALSHDDGSRALELLGEASERHAVSANLVSEKMTLLYRHGRDEEAQELLLAHLDRPALVAEALRAEVAANRFAHAVRLAEAAYAQQAEPTDRLRLARFIASAATGANRNDLLPVYVPPVIVADGSVDVLRGALDSLDDDHPMFAATSEAALAAVEQSSLRGELKDGLRAELLLLLGKLSTVEDLLYRSTYQTVIAKFLPRLVGRIPDEDFALLLETKLREHLSDKFGRSPAEWTAKVLDEVARRSRTDVATPVVAGLRRDFKQRPALLDALDAKAL